MIQVLLETENNPILMLSGTKFKHYPLLIWDLDEGNQIQP